MKMLRLCIVSMSMLGFCWLLGEANPGLSLLPSAYADVAGPVFKLRKPAKLHADAFGASEVLEVVWTGDRGVWLDKQGVWVQLRMKKTNHIGWIHYKYLMPASMNTGQ